jgi:uncharacterized protein (DUF1800 family)
VDQRASIAWLARRVGFGLAPGQLDALSAGDLGTTVDRWLDPDATGSPSSSAPPDPWAGLDLPTGRPKGKEYATQSNAVIGSWLQAMVEGTQPFDEWMRWFWHGHFVSSLRVVHFPTLMVQQLRTLGAYGLGDFRTLLGAVTVDPAMLIYLNGNTNVVGQINENYGREVLELFTLGIGNYTEHDVRAGATALTGWAVAAKLGTSRFVPRRHDDTPQTYLARSGVHDVDSVLDAVVAHPACAPFIAGKLARAILGPQVDTHLVTRLADGFASSGLQIRPLVREIVEAGLDGASTPMVTAPVPWSVQMIRATGVGYPAVRGPLGRALTGAGQIPLDAPNVGGWPGGPAWLTSSATLARFDLAATVAQHTSDTTPAGKAAVSGDLGALADALGHPEGFAAPTSAALRDLPDDGARPGVSRLTLAMAAPDMALG